MQRRLIVWMIALGTVIAAQNSSHATGAIAVGIPPDVAKDGAEFQVSFNFKTTAEAIERALSKCRAGTSSATKLCKIMATFNNHCGAEALDPQPGTPGFGWALEGSGQEAKDLAMANCRSTAGPSRQDACKVVAVGCDGTAKE